MTLHAFNTPLSVIGFNAIFNDLDNIDQVEASLYRGDALTASRPLEGSYSDLCQRCANLVFEINHLTAKQVAVIVVNDDAESLSQIIEGAEQAHFSYQHVAHVNDALQRSHDIIKIMMLRY